MTITETTPELDATQDATTATLPAAEVEAAPEPTPDADAAPEAAHNREAAKYRRQLREVEAERDTLSTQLDAMRRAQIDALLAAERRPAKGELLFAAGVQMSELLADDGTVDRKKVIDALDAAGVRLGVAVVHPAVPSASGQGNTGKPLGYGAPTFADAFRAR